LAEYKGIEYLRRKLESKRGRVKLRYKYYDMKHWAYDPGITIPSALKEQYKATLGWCGKAVDGLADRLVFRGFSPDNDNFNLNQIYQMNNADVLFDSAILGALISSCDFIYISTDESGYPRLQVISGGDATGVMDPITMMLNEGYAVLERDSETERPTLEAYFIAGRTTYIQGRTIWSVTNEAPYALMVPIVYRPDASRPFGHSRISRACMYLQEYAKRVLERSEISAEFYSWPQRYVVGMDPAAEHMDAYKAAMSMMLQFDKDEDGESPSLGQFAQQSMSPYTEQLRTAASAFAGETGLTLDDLGFVSDNPSSAEAIKASHENLRLAARKAQRTFGTGFLNAGFLAACLRDQYTYQRKQIYLTTPRWYPIFEPDSSMLSLIGDGAIKLNTALPGYVTEPKLEALTGI